MMLRRTTNKRMSIMAILFMLLNLLPFNMVYADETINLGASTSLTLDYHDGSTVFSGVDVKVYRVADVDTNVIFTLSGDFSSYPVSLSCTNNSQWNAAAQTLASYAVADNVTAQCSGNSDVAGKISFSALTTGLYLVVSKPVKVGSTTYSFAPFLISLPNLNDEKVWNYDVTSAPKNSAYTPSTPGGGGGGGGDTTTHKIVKHWRDEGHESERPDKITVEIYKDGELYSSQILSESNNWSYSWTDTKSAIWTIVERSVPEPYDVSIVLTGTFYTVTNTYTEVLEKFEIPDLPEETTEITEPDVPAASMGTSEEITPDGEIEESTLGRSVALPQTGLLWWPVVALSFSGIVLFIAGWFIKRKRENEDERRESQ